MCGESEGGEGGERAEACGGEVLSGCDSRGEDRAEEEGVG